MNKQRSALGKVTVLTLGFTIVFSLLVLGGGGPVSCGNGVSCIGQTSVILFASQADGHHYSGTSPSTALDYIDMDGWLLMDGGARVDTCGRIYWHVSEAYCLTTILLDWPDNTIFHSWEGRTCHKFVGYGIYAWFCTSERK